LRKATYATVVRSPGTHTFSVNPISNSTDGGSLKSDERPTKDIVIEAKPNKAYFVDIIITYGFGKLEPIFTLKSEEEALSVLKRMKHISNSTL
jgi:hypothetical protein